MAAALFRPFYALLLLAGFVARASGLEHLHPCPTTAAAHGAKHEGHEHGRTLPGADRCECVGQSCATSVAAPVGRTALQAAIGAATIVGFATLAVEPRSPVPHLLPFAHGPPA